MKYNPIKTIISIGLCALTTTVFAKDETLDNPPTSGYTNSAPITSEQFVRAAAAADRKEIRVSQLALEKTQNSDVKSFAKKIISDHQKACAKLKTIADKEGVEFPSTNTLATTEPHDSDHPGVNAMGIDTNSPATVSSAGIGHQNYKGAEVMQYGKQTTTNADYAMEKAEMNLDTLTGAEFDRAYVSHMVACHKTAIRKFEVASASLQDADLKKYADKTLPTLRTHLRMAQELQSKLGVSSYTDNH